MGLKDEYRRQGRALWESMPQEGRRLCCDLGQATALLGCRAVSNLSEVLALGKHPTLCALMRASGVEEAYITGGASDYDQAEALAEVLPLWAGHPYYASIHTLLDRLFDCRLPLRKETLPLIWQTVAERLAGEGLTHGDFLAAWGYDCVRLMGTDGELSRISESRTERLRNEKKLCLTSYLAPEGLDFPMLEVCENGKNSGAEALDALRHTLEGLLDQAVALGAEGVTANLSSMERFLRPNPYGAGRVCQKLLNGDSMSAPEADLLRAQLLRIVGQGCVQRGLSLELVSVRPTVFAPLSSYLKACQGWSTTTCRTSDPIQCAELSLMGASVTLEMDLLASDDEAFLKLSSCAARMPIGSLCGLCVPVRGLIDLPVVDRIEQVFCACVVQWGEEGQGNADPEGQKAVAQRVLR